MTEENVLQTITGNRAPLTRNEVDKISESITEAIYNTTHTRSIYENTERLNSLILLQNSCFLYRNNHIRINATNYSCFLKAIQELSGTNDKDNYERLPTFDVTNSVIEYYERLGGLYQQRQMLVNIITEYDRKKHEVSDISYKTPCRMYNCLNELKLIQECVDDLKVQHEEVPVSKTSTGLAYALLNFDDTIATTLLCDTLRQWSLKQLHIEEATFINYLWENLDLVNHDVFIILIENFKFVLEKIIIKMCTNVLQSDDLVLTPSFLFVYMLVTKKFLSWYQILDLVGRHYVLKYRLGCKKKRFEKMETIVAEVEEEEVVQLSVNNENLYTEGDGDTVFIQENQLVIPITGRTVVLQDEQGNYQQYIINDSPEEAADESIVYYTGDYSEDGVVITPDQDDSKNLDDSSIVFSPDNVQEPLYQYAILSNGKLHLQTIDANDEINDGLQAQIDELQQSIRLDDTFNETALDLDKITGRNLITGQTVTLDSYFNKLQKRLYEDSESSVRKRKCSDNDELLNKKVLIGKTANGKKIVGKILHVQTNKTLENVKVETVDVGEVSQPQIIIKKHVVTRENFDSNVGKTLAGLMDLETVQHKLRDKNLVVKLVDKVYEFGTDNFSKTISYVYGHMELLEEGEAQQKWCFVLHNDPPSDDAESSNADSNEAVADVSLQMDNGYNDSNDTVSLTILTVIDRNGKKSTRVNLNPQQPRNKCHLCSKEFKTALQVRKHISNVHLSEKWTSCDVCGKMFTNAAFLQRHKKIHTGEKWYQCPKCPKSFNTAGSLKRHLTVHDPSLRPLECSVCVQRFTDESSLRKHLLIHTGIRAYLCEFCNRAFRNQGDLNFHRRIHDPIKQFSCEVCGRAFSRHSNMIRHAEIHRGTGALHQCDICGCSYSFISSLTRHIVQKHISDPQV
ncbi:hypothetical protein RN001_011248 [Aquatica leii]|uniref:C2H2-type domain-containing protein n=1 Tax=Aquatica leii TaxID=1421715 RepID=A0AAN7P7N2_9COLE|nr:hypothetical protein RN001_011248 [Aquatica leii]